MKRWVGFFVLASAVMLWGAPGLCAQKKKAPGARTPTPTNINTASVLELTYLPGIGVKRAQAIVDHREEIGPFKTKQGVMDIPGIGKKTFDKLEPLISVRDRGRQPF